MALQRDTTFNATWTNGEGYNDGTAGAALNNVMRANNEARKTQEPRKHQVSVLRPQNDTKPQPSLLKTDDEARLKTARTVFTIIQQVAQLQGFSLSQITLHDKTTSQDWVKDQLMAPKPKK